MKPIRLNKQYLDKLLKSKIPLPELGTFFLLGKHKFELIGGWSNGCIYHYYLLNTKDFTVGCEYQSIYAVLEAYYVNS